MSVNGSVGPYGMQALAGRMHPLRPSIVLTSRGAKVGRPRAVPSYLTSTEAYSSLADAWQRARVYRSWIASWAPVVDGAGVVCEAALVCDVRCRVVPAAGGATLITDWTMVAHAGWLQTGAAAVVDIATLPAVAPTAPPAAIADTGSAIGTLACDAISGDIQWPLSSGQVELMRKMADLLAIEGIPQPAADDASVEAVICAATEQDAALIQATLNAYAGNYVVIKIGGVAVGPAAVHGVTVDKRVSSDTTVTGKPIACLVSMRCALEPAEPADWSSPSVAVLQYAQKWGSWIDIKGATVWSANVGICGAIGTATAELDIGRTLRGGDDASAKKLEQYEGRWCRIGVRVDREGKPSRIGTDRRWIWYGIIRSTELTSAAASSATMTLSMVHITAALQEIVSPWWSTNGRTDAGGLTTFRADQVQGYNIQQYGDRSLAAGDIDAQAGNVYRHNRYEATPASRREWECSDVIRNIIYHLNRHSRGPVWQYGGQAASLDYVTTWDHGRKSFIDLLNSVASTRHGLCWWADVTDAGTPVAMVRSVSDGAISIGPNTIPASDRIIAKVDTTDKKIRSCSLRRDSSLLRDVVYVEGGHPLFVGTWGFRVGETDANDRGLQKGWTSDEETEWDAASESVKKNKLAHVWRRFVLGPKFNGTTLTSGTQQIWFGRDHDGTGESGKYTNDPSLGFPKVEDLRFARYLPWPRNDQPINKTNQFGGALKSGAGYAEPRAYIYDQTGLEIVRDLTEEYIVTVEEDAAAVLLGNPEQAQDIKAAIDDGSYTLAFTLALIHPMAWRVSWERDLADVRRNWRTGVVMKYPEINYWACIDKTLVLQGDDGAPLGPDLDELYDDTMPSAFHVGFGGVGGDADNRPRLKNILDMVKWLYIDGSTGFTWTTRGIVFQSDDTVRLGDYVQTAKIQIDSYRAVEQNIGSVVVGISWEFSADNMLTHVECSRLIPGVDGAAVGVINPALHNGEDAAMLADFGAYQ
jgi:hypothetical protein